MPYPVDNSGAAAPYKSRKRRKKLGPFTKARPVKGVKYPVNRPNMAMGEGQMQQKGHGPMHTGMMGAKKKAPRKVFKARKRVY